MRGFFVGGRKILRLATVLALVLCSRSAGAALTLVSREMFQGVGTLNAATPGNLGTVTGSFYKRPAGPTIPGEALTASGEGWSADFQRQASYHTFATVPGSQSAGATGRMICGWYNFASVTDDGAAGRTLGLLASVQTTGTVNIAFSIDKTFTLSVLNSAGGTRTDAVAAPVLTPGRWYWLALAWVPNANNGYGNGDFRAYYRVPGGKLTLLTTITNANNGYYSPNALQGGANGASIAANARYGAASHYTIASFADVVYPSDLTDPVTARRNWYLNPATGNDNNDGTTAATAWASAAKLSTESANLGMFPGADYNSGDTLHINCAGAPLAIGTAPLEIRTAGLMVQQTGGALDPQTTLGPSAWTPVSGHPNVYATTDANSTDLVSVVVRENGKYLAHPSGSTFADVSSALDTTAGSFFCDDTTLYLHPFGDTDPRADGKTYRRTRNRSRIGATTNQALSAVIVEAPDVWYDGLVIAGTTLCAKADGDPLGAYGFQWDSGSGGVNLLSNFSVDHFSKHGVGETANGINSVYTRQDGVYGQATPYTGFGESTADVQYSGDAASTGIRWAFVRCRQPVNLGVIGSAAGVADPGTFFFISHAVGVAFAQGQFLSCQTAGWIGEQGCTAAVYMRDTVCSQVGTDCPLTAEECQTTAGVFTVGETTMVLRNCLMRITNTPTDIMFGSLGGSMDVAGCTIDLRGNALSNNATTAVWSRVSGSDRRTVSIRNTALLMDTAKSFTLLQGFDPGSDTLSLDNNLYQLGLAGNLFWPLNGTPLTFAQWRLAYSEDAHSLLVTNAGMDASGRPGYGSPALDAGVALGPLTDLDDAVVFPGRRTIGAYELRPTYAQWQANRTVASPDGSGVPGLLEYASGLAPGAPAAAAITTQPVAAAGQPRVAMTYHALQNAADLSYVPEVSADLRTWQSGASLVEQIGSADLGGGVSAITVRALVAPTGSPAWRFLRLRVTTTL